MTFCMQCPYGSTAGVGTSTTNLARRCFDSQNVPCSVWTGDYYPEYWPSKARDDDYNTYFVTYPRSNNYFAIHLTAEKFVESVAIWDAPPTFMRSRADGFKVYIGNVAVTGLTYTYPSGNTLCYTDTVRNSALRFPVVVTCRITASFVYIVSGQNDALNLAEVVPMPSSCVYCLKGTYTLLDTGYTQCQSCPAGQYTNQYHVKPTSITKKCGANKNILCSTWASTYSTSNANPSAAIDDDIYKFFQTEFNEPGTNFWGIDLESTYSDLQITFFDRDDVLMRNYQSEFMVFYGTYLHKNVNTWVTNVNNKQCYVDSTIVDNRFPVTFSCKGQGRYLYLVSAFAKQYFSIGEIIIYESNNICTPCAAGSYNGVAGSTGCQACSTGYFNQIAGSSSCTLCPTGSLITQAGTVCTPCPIGSYSTSPTMACTPCATSFYNTQTGSTSCIACLAGSFYNTQLGTCTQCGLGYYSPVPATACFACPAGKFNYIVGSTMCMDCPRGQYATGVGVYTTNLATWKCGSFGNGACTTLSSSIAVGSNPANVINKNVTDYFKTLGGTNQYWGIRLAGLYTLSYLIFHDRWDATRELEDQFEVWAFQNQLASAFDFKTYMEYRQYADTLYGLQRFPVTISMNNAYVGYVYILSRNPLGLNIGEVEIIYSHSLCTSCPITTYTYTSGSTSCTQCPPGTMGTASETKAQTISQTCFVSATVPKTSANALWCPTVGAGVKGVGSWWAQDLLYSQMVSWVVLTHATDCLKNNTQIFIGDYLETQTSYSYNPLNQNCSINNIVCPATVTCKLKGRYIYIVKTAVSSWTLDMVAVNSTCTVCGIGTYNSAFAQSTCQACKTCPAGTYYKKICGLGEVRDTSECATFSTTCPNGYYIFATPNVGTKLVAGQDSCKECEQRIGFYIIDGCYNGLPAVYQACTTCIGSYASTCSMWDDAICNYEIACTKTQSLTIPAWVTKNNIVPCSKGFYISNMSYTTPSCTPCPDYLVGYNGYWCEPCWGFRKPYWDNSLCICQSPTILSASGACVCPAGYSFTENGCQLCPINTYNSLDLVLLDNWWTQRKTCTACFYNSIAPIGATACEACPKYMYRHEYNVQCTSCPKGQYTIVDIVTDPMAIPNLECFDCRTSCSAGQYSVPCPSDSSLFICHYCNDLPPQATWLSMSSYATEYICAWKCNAGYYRGINECKKCSSVIQCDPGKIAAPCNDIQDVNCDWDCVNDTKPMFNSIWSKGCDWGCARGYNLQKIDYTMWVQYECVLNGSLQFWKW